MITPTSQKQTKKGKQTRNIILQQAVNIASVEGLEGLSIGKLAANLEMSKSGLFGHFGSKEGLQLAAIEAARQIFIDEVISPALKAERGLNRLWALCEAWLSYEERNVFDGGCFFMQVAAEFDNRPGPVRDAIAATMKEWLDFMEEAVRRAQAMGQIIPDADPAQVAFDIHALYLGANWAMQLYDDPQAPDRARVAILQRLHTLITPAAPSLPDPDDFRQ